MYSHVFLPVDMCHFVTTRLNQTFAGMDPA